MLGEAFEEHVGGLRGGVQAGRNAERRRTAHQIDERTERSIDGRAGERLIRGLGVCFMSSPLLPFVPLVAIVLRARAYASSLPLTSKIARLGACRHHAAWRDMAAIIAATALASLTRTFRNMPLFGSFRQACQV
jgi:hypothetical protein